MLVAGSMYAAEKIEVLCVGDSITYGGGSSDVETKAYPVQLQKILGDKYKVEKYGIGSCAVLRKARPKTIWTHLDKLKKYSPKIVVCMFGTNDTGGSNWNHEKSYKKDYGDFVDFLEALPSKPKVYLCLTTPMEPETKGLSAKRKGKLNMRKPRLDKFIQDTKELAKEKKTGLIDLNTPMANKTGLVKEGDGVHLSDEGYKKMAELIAAGIMK